MQEQNYAKHTKLVPGFHIVLGILALAGVILSLVNFYRRVQAGNGRTTLIVLAVNSIAIFLLFYYARTFAIRNQDRIIRSEENLRHFVLTGKLLDPRLSVKQIVGLRFASDAEFPDLARKAADSGMSLDEIKKSVKDWRPDHERV
jgi:hypothetical protein